MIEDKLCIWWQLNPIAHTALLCQRCWFASCAIFLWKSCTSPVRCSRGAWPWVLCNAGMDCWHHWHFSVLEPLVDTSTDLSLYCWIVIVKVPMKSDGKCTLSLHYITSMVYDPCIIQLTLRTMQHSRRKEWSDVCIVQYVQLVLQLGSWNMLESSTMNLSQPLLRISRTSSVSSFKAKTALFTSTFRVRTHRTTCNVRAKRRSW